MCPHGCQECDCELPALPHQSPLRVLSEVVSDVSAGVSTPELFRPLLRSLGNGGAAGGEAEAWRLCHPGTGQGGVEDRRAGGQEGRRSASGAAPPLP